jgi:hypothetical protein
MEAMATMGMNDIEQVSFSFQLRLNIAVKAVLFNHLSMMSAAVAFAKDYKIQIIRFCYHTINVITVGLAQSNLSKRFMRKLYCYIDAGF